MLGTLVRNLLRPRGAEPPASARPAGTPLRLHIGGREPHPDWQIVNIVPSENADYVRSCTDLSPFADGTVAEIYASHVVEHLGYKRDLVKALTEFHRVLEPGGRLLVSVPAYQWAWTDHDVANGHHRRYTRPRAVAALEAAGFEVRRATYGFSSVFPMFAGERVLRRLRQALTRRGPEGPADVVDVPEVGAGLERVLMGLCRLDERLLGSRDLPFGSSVFLAAVKP